MKADWAEVPVGDVASQFAGIHVTMNPKGHIALSRHTYATVGEPPAFILLFDKANSRIGLQPAQASSRNARKACVASRCGGKKVNGFRLLREYKIDLPHTLTFPDAKIDEDGVLVLDLRTAKPCPRAAGRKVEA